MPFTVETATGSIVGEYAHSASPERGTLELGLPALRRPALFVHGRGDPIPWAASAATAELIEDARLEILDGCGHSPWLERPGAIAAAVERPA